MTKPTVSIAALKMIAAVRSGDHDEGDDYLDALAGEVALANQRGVTITLDGV